MPIPDEELKAIFRANDYTTYVSKYSASKATVTEHIVCALFNDDCVLIE